MSRRLIGQTFLKELNLTEGRATGIPTIQAELKKNGSAAATIETDELRSYFLIDIPCHPDFITPIVQDIELTVRQKRIVELLSANPMIHCVSTPSFTSKHQSSVRSFLIARKSEL